MYNYWSCTSVSYKLIEVIGVIYDQGHRSWGHMASSVHFKCIRFFYLYISLFSNAVAKMYVLISNETESSVPCLQSTNCLHLFLFYSEFCDKVAHSPLDIRQVWYKTYKSDQVSLIQSQFVYRQVLLAVIYMAEVKIRVTFGGYLSS